MPASARELHSNVTLISILISMAFVLLGCVPQEHLSGYFAAVGVILGVIFSFGHWGSGKLVRISLLTLVSFCSLVLTAAGGDLLLRPLVLPKVITRPEDRFTIQIPHYPQLIRFQPERHFEGTVAGDLSNLSGNPADRVERKITFTTDRLGFRNDPSAPSGSYDLLALGDSYTVGIGTEQSRTWTRLLESDHGVRTYGMAVPGSPWHELMLFQLFGHEIKPSPGARLLLMFFAGNDLDEAWRPALDLEDIHDPDPLSWFYLQGLSIQRRSPIRLFWQRFDAINAAQLHDPRYSITPIKLGSQERILLYNLYLERAERSDKSIREHKNAAAVAVLLARLSQKARESGFNPVLVLAPSKEEIYPPPDHAQPRMFAIPSPLGTFLAQTCRDTGLDFFDLTPGMYNAAQEALQQEQGLLWWSDDTHWNEAGHKVAADLIFKNVLSGHEQQ